MHLLLTHGRFFDTFPEGEVILPPQRLLEIQAYLKASGTQVTLFDPSFLEWKDFVTFLEGNSFKHFVLYAEHDSRKYIIKMMKHLRGTKSLRNGNIILCGPDAIVFPEKYIEHGANAVKLGQEEESLFELISNLDTPLNPFMDTIPGIAFKNALGNIFKTKSSGEQVNSNKHRPDWSQLDLNKYLAFEEQENGEKMLSINAQRGCNFSCNFCQVPSVEGTNVRRVSSEKFARELIKLNKVYNPGIIRITDHVFGQDLEWLKQFQQELVKEDQKISFECTTRADVLDGERLKLLEASGCRKIWIGLESGSQKVLDKMGRGMKLAEIRTAIALIRESEGIEVGVNIMLGYPEEGNVEVDSTLRFLLHVAPDDVEFSIAYPISGTKFREQVKEFSDLYLQWEEASDRDIQYDRLGNEQFYKIAARWMKYELAYLKARQTSKLLPRVRAYIKTQFARFALNSAK